VKTRLQSVWVMLLALFVLGTAAQSAVCETVCGMQTSLPNCHSTVPQSEHSIKVAAAMEHCTGTMRMQSGDTIGSCHHGGCEHPPIVGLVKASSVEVHVSPVLLWVMAAFPPNLELPTQRMPIGRAPPPRLASIDPLVLSLRV